MITGSYIESSKKSIRFAILILWLGYSVSPGNYTALHQV